jgi:50S ribosomal subunit-associated GTPase HflX
MWSIARQVKAVDAVLTEMNLSETRRILVWNKSDATSKVRLEGLIGDSGGIAISAQTGHGMDRLLDEIRAELKLVKLNSDFGASHGYASSQEG